MDHGDAFWDVGLEAGRDVVSLGFAATLTAVSINVLLVGHLSLFFDLCFMVVCLALAALVRRENFYTVAVLPPSLMLAVFTFLAVVARPAIADEGDNFVQAVASGVATHGVALFAGYALCLGWLGWRLRDASPLTTEQNYESDLEVEPGQRCPPA